MTNPLQAGVDHAELLPCPFCGGRPGYSVEGFAFCYDCGCEGTEAPVEGEPGMGRRDAIAAWNRRAAPVLPDRGWRPDRGVVENAVAYAMNDAWCEICTDTGCWPEDIERVSARGPLRLEYRSRVWTSLTAALAADAILALPDAPAEGAE